MSAFSLYTSALRTLMNKNKRLKRLLRAARDALYEEIAAAGEEEVRQHPTLRAHARLVARIDKALEAK